jgi:hypothetical protein
MEEEKRHYYMFSFISPGNTYSRVTMGWPDMKVTESRIKEARDGALGFPYANACPLAVSYLGYMTREEAQS